MAFDLGVPLACGVNRLERTTGLRCLVGRTGQLEGVLLACGVGHNSQLERTPLAYGVGHNTGPQ